jgi:mono/diheme cytochrome c family protein
MIMNVGPEIKHNGVKERNMKSKNLVALMAVFLIALTVSLAAEDGTALYKKKCSGCHGASGEGKPAVKAPALKGTTLEASQIVEHTTKGEANSKPPHNKPIAGVDEEQAKAIAEFVKTLK